MTAVGTALGFSAGLMAIAAVTYAIAALAQSRSLPLNGLIGIRTRATRRSEAAWIAAHDAARPALLASSVISVCGSIGAVLAGVALNAQRCGDAVVVVFGICTYVIALVLLARATVKANAAARKVDP